MSGIAMQRSEQVTLSEGDRQKETRDAVLPSVALVDGEGLCAFQQK